MPNGGEAIVEYLMRERVPYVMGVCGHGSCNIPIAVACAFMDSSAFLAITFRGEAPFVLDVHVNRDVKPPGVGTWELPPLPYAEPTFGRRRLPGAQ